MKNQVKEDVQASIKPPFHCKGRLWALKTPPFSLSPIPPLFFGGCGAGCLLACAAVAGRNSVAVYSSARDELLQLIYGYVC